MSYADGSEPNGAPSANGGARAGADGGARAGATTVGSVSGVPYCDDVIGPDVAVLQLADVAKQLSVPLTRVEQLLRDGAMFAIRRNEVTSVPVIFLEEEGRVLKGLPGLISVLRDGGYADLEILRWLFTVDETLPGAPVEALHGNRAKEVTRRAQAMAL